MKTGIEQEPFGKLIEALEPWLDEVVIIGGWAHRLYRLERRAEDLSYSPLTTLDGDVAVPATLEAKSSSIRDRLLAAGFGEEFIGEARPPATHYYLAGDTGFYAEFLTPLVGSEYDRGGKRKATREVAGVFSQQLRYIDLLLIAPWKVGLGKESGYPFKWRKHVQVANPTCFLAQKILIHHERDHKDRAKDLLYLHDTIETFSGHLGDLHEIFAGELRKRIHKKRIKELSGSAEHLFSKVDDTVREAARIATGRKLNANMILETCRAGLQKIFH